MKHVKYILIVCSIILIAWVLFDGYGYVNRPEQYFTVPSYIPEVMISLDNMNEDGTYNNLSIRKEFYQLESEDDNWINYKRKEDLTIPQGIATTTPIMSFDVELPLIYRIANRVLNH